MWWLPACTLPTGAPVQVTVEDAPEAGVPLAHRFHLTADRDGPLALRCGSDADPPADTIQYAWGSADLVTYGLLADTEWACAVQDGLGRVAWEGSFRTEPLPADLPTLHGAGDADRAALDDGFVLFSHWRTGDGPRVYRLVIADGAGRVRWWLDLPGALSGGTAATWLGDRMVVGGGGTPPGLRDLSGAVEFTVGPPLFPDPEDDVYNHEAALTPEGVLSLQTVPDCDDTATWRGFRLEVTDVATGETRWAADSRDAVADGFLPAGTQEEDDPYHANAAAWRDDDPEGPSVWLSLRRLHQLVRIDRRTGAWRFVGDAGGQRLFDPDGGELPPTEWWQGQHAPEYRGAEVLVFDNGAFRPGPRHTRVARYTLAGDRATLAWSWTEPGWYEPNYGSVQTLPSGHVVVGSGHSWTVDGTGGASGRSFVAEVDPETDEVVWRLRFAEAPDTLYRAQLLDGCALFSDASLCPVRWPDPRPGG